MLRATNRASLDGVEVASGPLKIPHVIPAARWTPKEAWENPQLGSSLLGLGGMKSQNYEDEQWTAKIFQEKKICEFTVYFVKTSKFL